MLGAGMLGARMLGTLMLGTLMLGARMLGALMLGALMLRATECTEILAHLPDCINLRIFLHVCLYFAAVSQLLVCEIHRRLLISNYELKPIFRHPRHIMLFDKLIRRRGGGGGSRLDEPLFVCGFALSLTTDNLSDNAVGTLILLGIELELPCSCLHFTPSLCQ